MNDVFARFEFRGVLCFARPSATTTFYFVPLHADLDRDAGGHPALSMIAIGSNGYLMLTAVWRATDAVLDALRKEIAARSQIDDPSTIRLMLAPAKVTRCELLLGDGSGHFQTLASSSTSGVPPYSAVFGVSLTGEQFARAAAAVNGRFGFLAIEYDAILPTPVLAAARLVPQSARLAPWLRDFVAKEPATFRSALEDAIDEGLATIVVRLPEHPPSQLVTRLYEQLLRHAAAVLPGMIGSGDEGGIADLQVEVELVEEISEPIRPRADLASLVFDPTRIAVADGGASPAERAARRQRPLQVRLGFDPTSAPLAWVRVRRGESEAVLRAPEFGRAELSGDWQAGALTVTSGFTNGAANHRLDLPPPDEGELVLSPEDLGLRMLSVDARPLAEAGLRSAEISLRYRPPRRVDEQHGTIRFQNDAWLSPWWVASATASWLGFVEYNWKAITPEGRAVGESGVRTDSSKITLALHGGIFHASN